MIDFCDTTGAVILDQEVDLIIQQIEILFDTRNGDVLGEYDYGTRFDTYLFNPNIGNRTIESEVKSYIMQNVELFGWTLDISVEFLAGTQNDILLMKIEFSKNSDVYYKIYKVSQGSVDYI
jgi:phage baseplate assembly protein W